MRRMTRALLRAASRFLFQSGEMNEEQLSGAPQIEGPKDNKTLRATRIMCQLFDGCKRNEASQNRADKLNEASLAQWHKSLQTALECRDSPPAIPVDASHRQRYKQLPGIRPESAGAHSLHVQFHCWVKAIRRWAARLFPVLRFALVIVSIRPAVYRECRAASG